MHTINRTTGQARIWELATTFFCAFIGNVFDTEGGCPSFTTLVFSERRPGLRAYFNYFGRGVCPPASSQSWTPCPSFISNYSLRLIC